MTDYNDGKWIGWNGGDCPVHPKSEVFAVCQSMCSSEFRGASFSIAEDLDWGIDNSYPIIAFRVTKPYREPRTFYVNEYPNSTIMPHLYCSEVDAGIGAGKNRVRAVKLIEAIE